MWSFLGRLWPVLNNKLKTNLTRLLFNSIYTENSCTKYCRRSDCNCITSFQMLKIDFCEQIVADFQQSPEKFLYFSTVEKKLYDG